MTDLPIDSAAGASHRHSAPRLGVLYAAAAFLWWGAAPIYFKAVGQVPPFEILAHRILWSLLLVGAIVLAVKPAGAIRAAIGGPRRLGVYVATTLLVSLNWLVFIWAIAEGHLLQASLGYYINPLINVLLGMAFLGERLSRPQALAVAIATIGVSGLVVAHGEVPWVALVLALSFGFYALIRKKAAVDPLLGLLIETALLAPLALGFLVWLGLAGGGAFGRAMSGGGGLPLDLLLVLSGVVTAVPLILFMSGAQRLKLSTIGLMQYLAPTGHFLLGVFLYGEPFTPAHGFAFACIWIALALYSNDTLRSHRAGR
ncbi:MAG: EamA family transporter RarD [Azospirillum sp.]|nr:EamA family transporter RarD [Azospirillum sp.]